MKKNVVTKETLETRLEQIINKYSRSGLATLFDQTVSDNTAISEVIDTLKTNCVKPAKYPAVYTITNDGGELIKAQTFTVDAFLELINTETTQPQVLLKHISKKRVRTDSGMNIDVSKLSGREQLELIGRQQIDGTFKNEYTLSALIIPHDVKIDTERSERLTTVLYQVYEVDGVEYTDFVEANAAHEKLMADEDSDLNEYVDEELVESVNDDGELVPINVLDQFNAGRTGVLQAEYIDVIVKPVVALVEVRDKLAISTKPNTTENKIVRKWMDLNVINVIDQK